MSAISFTAYGTPAPKGSMKAVMPKGARFPVLTEDNEHTRPWAVIVKAAAIEAIGAGKPIPFPKGTPVTLDILFRMKRPVSLPKKVEHHTKKPDLDKLVRCVKDSLTGIVWDDDSQVVAVCALKKYAINDMPRAEINVAQLQGNGEGR